MQKPKDAVVRFSVENHERLKSLAKEIKKETNRKVTINDLMNKLLDSMDQIRDGELKYMVGAQVFSDISEARGEAIMQAVRNKEVPQWPKVIVVLGEDNGV